MPRQILEALPVLVVVVALVPGHQTLVVVEVVLHIVVVVVDLLEFVDLLAGYMPSFLGLSLIHISEPTRLDVI
eukprot:2163031-Prorocentrum_lima.AAC.1